MNPVLHPAQVVGVEQPRRTRLLLLIAAWWTLAQMENTGSTFDDFLAAAIKGDGQLTFRLWDELTSRLHRLSVEALGVWPEAVLTPEAREFIEKVVNTMTQSATSTGAELH